MKTKPPTKAAVATPVYDQSRKRWRVSIPAGKNPDGKRVRSWHATREDARAYLASILSGPEPSAVIPPSLAMKADEARLILEPHNLDLVEAAKILSSVLNIIGDSGTPLEAAKAWRLTHDQRTASKTFGDAKELFMLTRDGLREDTLRGYRQYLNNVFRPLHESTLSDITAAGIEGCLTHLPASSRKAAQTALGVFWRWAASPPRQWCQTAVVGALEPVRLSREKEIHTLTPESAKAILHAAEQTSPGTAVAFAVAIFGGVRLRELGKLTWSNITEEHIEVSASVAKRHSRRLIPICPTLKAWIQTYRGSAADDDLIVGPNWVNHYQTARRRGGWNVATQRPLEGVEAPHRGEWQQNCMRHTCASLNVAIGRPLEDLIFSFGHSGGTALLKQHYLGKLTKRDALAILSIGPRGTKIKTIAAA